MHTLLLPAILLVTSLSAQAAVVTTTNNEIGPGGVNWTPSYVVSGADLINGMTPAASSGDFSVELSGGTSVLTNGSFGVITFGGNAGVTHNSFGVAGGGSATGTSVTYNLGANPLGYNISSVSVYGGWNDNGRDQQFYSFSYHVIGAPSFTTAATVNFNPTIAANLQSAIQTTLTENALPFLASGVDQVRFDFPSAPENGYTGYSELDVIGTAVVPEPGTFLLTAAGSVALLARRRRQA